MILPVFLFSLPLACSEYGVSGKPPGEEGDTSPGPAPDIQVAPGSVAFEPMELGAAPGAAVPVWIRNVGAADLHLSALTIDGGAGAFSVSSLSTDTLAPEANTEVLVSFEALAVGAAGANLQVDSDDPDEPRVLVPLSGAGSASFSAGWYVLDDGVPYETTSSAEHLVDHHGDEDLYWYEPSGVHGMLDSVDVAGDFAIMREYVISRVGAPTPVTGPFDWAESSGLATFEFATFTYFLCDFYLPLDEDPGRYEIRSDGVDDGIQVMVNGAILGRLSLGEAGGSWGLEGAVPGAMNTLIIILVDDSQIEKFVHGLAFYRDGVMVLSE